MTKLKKNDLIKARKHCDIFRFIGVLNSTNDGWEIDSHYCNLYAKESEPGKEHTGKHEASFLDLEIKMRDAKFEIDLFDKRDSFHFLLS